MIIDIVVILATVAVISTTAKDRDKADYFSVSLLRFLRFLQVLRVLRIDRQQGQLHTYFLSEHRYLISKKSVGQNLQNFWLLSFFFYCYFW